MTIEELIAEGEKLQASKLTSAKDKTRYHTWMNNCLTYLEQIKFSKQRSNLFLADALNQRFESMMGVLISIRDNQKVKIVTAPHVKNNENVEDLDNAIEVVTNCDNLVFDDDDYFSRLKK